MRDKLLTQWPLPTSLPPLSTPALSPCPAPIHPQSSTNPCSQPWPRNPRVRTPELPGERTLPAGDPNPGSRRRRRPDPGAGCAPGAGRAGEGNNARTDPARAGEGFGFRESGAPAREAATESRGSDSRVGVPAQAVPLG